MPPGVQHNRRAQVLRDAAFGIAFFLLPAFFIYGSHDLWNLPRSLLSMAFLAIAIPLAAFQKAAFLRLSPPALYLGLAWAAWTLLSIQAENNAGDLAYVLGIRLTGAGMVLWLAYQRQADRILPFLVLLGAGEAAIGLGELLGLVRMNALMHVPIGTAGNNNVYGCLMALLLPFPLLLLLRAQGPRRILLAVAAAAIALLALVSSSRTAVIALPIAALSIGALHLLKHKTALLRSPLPRQIAIAAIPLLIIATPIAWAAINFQTGQFATEETTGITERGMLWRESIDMVQEAPLLGSGPTSWKYQVLHRGITGYSTEYGLRFFTRPHNDFLWTAAESGIPAALCYIALLTYLFYSSVRQAWRAQDRTGRLRFYLLAAGILIWIVISSLNFPLERIDHLIVFAAYAGLLMSHSKLEGKYVKGLGKGLGLLLAGGLALLLVIGLQRYRQDRHLQDLEIARKANQPQKVLDECAKTRGPFFTVDYYTSTPIALYAGVALLQTGKTQEALDQLSEAYATNPSHPHVLNNLASTYVILGDFEEAGNYYREAIETFRDFPDPYVNLSRIMLAKGDSTGAIALLRSFPDEANSHKRIIYRELEKLGK